MKKNFLFALALGTAVVGFTSCNNSELEGRVEKLEQRMAALEGNGNGAAVTTSEVSNTADLHEGHDHAVSATEVEGPAPEFQFENPVYDFGTVKEGEPVKYTYRFKNVGEAPLIIQSAAASCGCTVPDYSKKPVAVGETGEIHVSFDSNGRVGVQNKTITVTANTNPSVMKLTLKGTVEAKGGNTTTNGPVK